ncbi:glutathione S-transferase [Bowmanella sp. Y26]|uniref:Glutathione S-transferase n=1 Tax=Bowmanella yangjiangensis TaxID=2811230 RepID=A0ABS3CV22_9ALTE|nr:glutathione S-transferase [Bowmanella yangjiangensis]MBN7820165.1 glutathione S-transferase [Bowmanella yangjiangensis]MBT1065366.1 glutathione S-transferase [Bowmanella yangjiangensis]
MLTLHHLNNSRSQRILWLLEELQVPYEIKTYQRDTKTMLAPPALKDVHPLGKSPLITDAGQLLAESGAIIQYLCEQYGPQWIPEKGTQDYLQYHYWLHFAEGSLMPPMLLKLVMDKIRSNPMPFFIRPVAKGIASKVMQAFVSPNIQNNLNFIEHSLVERQWLAGSRPSGADVQMSFPLEAALARGLVPEYHTNIRRYVERIHARPAYQRALKAGGDYAYAG